MGAWILRFAKKTQKKQKQNSFFAKECILEALKVLKRFQTTPQNETPGRRPSKAENLKNGSKSEPEP